MDYFIPGLICIYVFICFTVLVQSQEQTDLNYMGNNLHIRVSITDNLEYNGNKHTFEVVFTNNGNSPIPKGKWKIYFYSFFMIESDHLPAADGYILPHYNMKVRHVQGCLFSIEPTNEFAPIQPKSSKFIEFFGQNWAVSKTDVPPNWYVAMEGLKPVLIKATEYGRDFISDMVSVRQWKRFRADTYNPYTPQDRYGRFVASDRKQDEMRILPKPKQFQQLDKSTFVNFKDWSISSIKNFEKEATYLAGKLRMNFSIHDNIDKTSRREILMLEESGSTHSPDWYKLEVSSTQDRIILTGQTASGIFYAIQSMLSLVSIDMNTIPVVTIIDEPRYEYRGMHVDLARNFIGKASLMKLIDVMAIYKMNKLHLHLTDDEGWRVEIPDLPELTQVGAKRCHDLNENDCIIPQLGSGPSHTTSGSGFLSVADYKTIVSHAEYLHIEVIPEVDMPGHARAAIKAMEARYRKYIKSDPTEANKYRLIDPTDNTKFFSVQMFNDNIINPCIESTYAFVEKVVRSLKSIHNNLKTFHFGGDEIAGTWINSSECQKLGKLNSDYQEVRHIADYFVKRVANITHQYGLNLAGWEDGLLKANKVPIQRDQLPNTVVYGNAWDNVWENGASRHAYDLANNGYKVIMSQATHLYFDHPYEPDPEERGLYWAPRYTDTLKTFQFMPDDVYANIDYRISGAPITRLEVCGKGGHKCPSLKTVENIVGIQGHLWSETVLNDDIFDYMVYPRLLAVAERAWHKASWEDTSDVDIRWVQMRKDWEGFASVVGHKELERLESMNVGYRVAPPGARVSDGILKVKTEFPGMDTEYSKDNGNTWRKVPNDLSYTENGDILLRASSGSRTSRVVTFSSADRIPIPDQTEVDYVSNNIEATFEVVNNLVNDWHNFTQRYTFKNVGDREIRAGNWSIYFYHIRLMEPDAFPFKQGHLYRDCALRLFHVAGSLYKLQPEIGMFSLMPKKNVTCFSTAKYWQAARKDTMPNWFISAEGMAAKVIQNTAGESLKFVKQLLKPEQVRRYPEDNYLPYTPSERFAINDDVLDKGTAVNPLIPTPVQIQTRDRQTVVDKTSWKVIYSDEFENEVKLCAIFFQVEVSFIKPKSKFIHFEKVNVTVLDRPATAQEAYILRVDSDSDVITITAPSSKGGFYALQTLRKLSSETNKGRRVPDVEIKDQPRFNYRGMHVDVGRNFHSKAEILKLLEAMAIYKLNKFHFHLTEDEGWRIQINGLEELTEIGSKRCFDPEENKCTTSQLGSGPTDQPPGSGFYTTEDYKEILRYANERHIQVIPEVDMPGHCRAGIKAMEERYRKYMKYGNASAAEEYLLSEEGDTSEYITAQFFTDNAINPCLNSTFVFIRHVMEAFIEMHKDIQPLTIYHFGADEVARGAWEKSEACKTFMTQNPEISKVSDLMTYFGKRVGELAALEKVDIGAWEDGLMDHGNVPFNRSHFPESPREVYGYAWSNIWEFGGGDRAYRLANAGYKVILSHATHLYFDHPYEPDPEERGYYWATRFTDTRKTFGYIPDDIYANADISHNGYVLKPEEICVGECLQLEEPENIIGIQGQLWSETVRTDEQLDFMIFPRLLALAERAWHKASWETIPDKRRRKQAIFQDWVSFANNLGYRELLELDKQGIRYRVPVPGAKIENGELLVNSAFPGLEVQFSIDDKKSWKSAKGNPKITSSATIHIRTLSADKTRHSRVISLEGIGATYMSTAVNPQSMTYLLCILVAFLYCIFM